MRPPPAHGRSPQVRSRRRGRTCECDRCAVKHLAWAEDRWFVGRFLGQALPEPWHSAPLETEPDWPFESSAADSVADLVALYQEACERSRTAARNQALDAVAAEASFGWTPSACGGFSCT
ncbi:MAG: DUF664 domain-containing protein [Acidimicrobiales bacterium]